MRIGVDVDGVIRDLHSKLVQVYRREYPKTSDESENWCEDISDWFRYEISIFFSIGNQIYDFWFVAHSEEIYLKSLPFENVKESINMLRKAGHEIIMLTSQPNFNTSVYTFQWLYNNNIKYDSITFTNNKASVDCDIYIDDSPGYIDQLSNAGKKIVICDLPWNLTSNGSDRVKSFAEFAKNILEGKYK